MRLSSAGSKFIHWKRRADKSQGIKKARMAGHKYAESVLLGSPSDTVLKADFVRSWQ